MLMLSICKRSTQCSLCGWWFKTFVTCSNITNWIHKLTPMIIVRLVKIMSSKLNSSFKPLVFFAYFGNMGLCHLNGMSKKCKSRWVCFYLKCSPLCYKSVMCMSRQWTWGPLGYVEHSAHLPCMCLCWRGTLEHLDKIQPRMLLWGNSAC